MIINIVPQCSITVSWTDVMAYIFNLSIREVEADETLKFKATLIYIVSPRPDRAT